MSEKSETDRLIGWAIIIIGVATIALALFSGCASSTKAIGRAVSRISDDAMATSVLAASISKQAVGVQELASATPGIPVWVSESQGPIIDAANQIQAHQSTILESASTATVELAGVEDRVPWWASLLGNATYAIVALAILILVWQTGIGTFIRKLLWGLGLFIPSASMAEAKMDIDSLHSTEPRDTMREAVAAKRARDPAYAAARRKLKGQ